MSSEWPIRWSRSRASSRRSFIVFRSLPRCTPSTSLSISEYSGPHSSNENLLLRAESRDTRDLSAVFMVPRMLTLPGTPNLSREYGRVTLVSSLMPIRLVLSMRVMASPRMPVTFPLLISSMMSTRGPSAPSASWQNRLNTPSLSS